MNNQQLEQLAINTIRTLSIDAVQQAKSGHPGTRMSLAPLVYIIWSHHPPSGQRQSRAQGCTVVDPASGKAEL